MASGESGSGESSDLPTGWRNKPEWCKKQIRQALAADRVADPSAYNESRAGNGAQGSHAAQEAHASHCIAVPVRISYTCYVKRLADSDARISKWVTDALVRCGILHDDSSREIPESPVIRQIKSKEEKTVVEVHVYDQADDTN